MPKTSTPTQEVAETRKTLTHALGSRYKIQKLLGSGGAGHAYLIQEKETGLLRVAKILRPSARRLEKLRNEFLNEATKLAQLRHPNLVGVYGQSQTSKLPYFVMEFVKGDDLETTTKLLVKQHSGGEWVHSVHRIVLQLAEVLDYLHTQRPHPLLHLDVKPANVVVHFDNRKRPRPVLLDFGVAQYARNGRDDPRKTQAIGTFPMWPERYLKTLQRHTSEGRTVFLIRRDQLNTELDLHLFGRTILAALETGISADPVDSTRWSSIGIAGYRFIADLAASLLIDTREHPLVKSAWEVVQRLERVERGENRSRGHFDEGFVRLPGLNLRSFGTNVRALTDWPQFQRLRGISQLGLVSMVYPGATHTRFEHSLGVFENAIEVLDHVAGPRGDTRFRSVVSDEELVATALVALFHDIGHYPFAHQFRISGRYPQHERRTLEVVKGADAEKLVTGHFSRDVYSCMVQLMTHLVEAEEGKAVGSTPVGVPPQYRVFRSMLSSSIDVDKLDYVARDATHAGVPYGRVVDRPRFLSALRVWWNEKSEPELLLSDKGRACAEALGFARYLMFSEVYWNHCVRAYAAMVSAALAQCGQESVGTHLWDGDAMFLEWLTNQGSAGWLRDLLGVRKPYRRAFVQPRFGWGDGTLTEDEKLFGKMEDAARGEGDALEVVRRVVADVVGAKEFSEHEIVVDVPREVGSVTGVRVLPEGQEKPVSAGPIYAGIGKTFDGWARKARVFVHPKFMSGRSVMETSLAVRSELLKAFVIE